LRAWERLNTAYYVNYGGGKETLAHFKDNEWTVLTLIAGRLHTYKLVLT
jgi:hypothetical protein